MSEMNDWNKQIVDLFHANGGKNVPPFGDALLLLTTVGAKSGDTRINPLVYTRDGNRYVIIASKGGHPNNPAWYHNLMANPVTTIEVGTEKIPVKAIEIKGQERENLYNKQAALYPGFAEYQQKTSRVIPLIVLEPIAPR